MISQRTQIAEQSLPDSTVMNECMICGSPIIERVGDGFPRYCRRHQFIMVRVLELIGNQASDKAETQRFLEQAENEAAGIFGGIGR
jgi:hypothetical protein